MRPKKGACLVEIRPGEELPRDFCVRPRRILVPTALDEASAVALDYASALARRFGSALPAPTSITALVGLTKSSGLSDIIS